MIPHDDGAGAIIAARDSSLEACVVERMIFDELGEAADFGIEARSFRNRPAAQGTADLQTQIIVQMRSMVALNAILERSAGLGMLGCRGLRSPVEMALFAVFFE